MTNGIFIWCGDSWTKGGELPLHQRKDNGFTGLVSEALKFKNFNFARSGSSIGHLVYDVDRIIKVKQKTNLPVIALFGLTVHSRLCLENQAGHKKTISANTYDTNAYVNWAQNILNDEFLLKECCLSLSWIGHQLQQANIPYAFYNILSSFYDFEKSKFSKYLDREKWLVNPYWNTYGHLFDLEKFDINKMQVLEKCSFGKKRLAELFMPGMHPNAQGHKMIADTLLPEIEQLIKVNL